MKVKEYEMPDGIKAAFEYDENGVGKITLECMNMLMGQLIAYKRCIQNRSFWDAKHCDGCMFYDNCPFNPQEDEDKPQTMYYPQVDGITPSVIVKDEPQTCDTCKYGEDKHRYAHICNECGVGINNYEPKDEPQDECAKEYEELGLRKLKELRKDEPQTEREGEWIWDEQILGLVCSECKELGVERSNFCPNCGAKMKGADDE